MRPRPGPIVAAFARRAPWNGVIAQRVRMTAHVLRGARLVHAQDGVQNPLALGHRQRHQARMESRLPATVLEAVAELHDLRREIRITLSVATTALFDTGKLYATQSESYT